MEGFWQHPRLIFGTHVHTHEHVYTYTHHKQKKLEAWHQPSRKPYRSHHLVENVAAHSSADSEDGS